MNDITDNLEKRLKLQKTITDKPFTLLWINSMAMTCALKGNCTSVVFLPNAEPQIIFRQGRERRLRSLRIKHDMLILSGHNLPLISDMEADLGTWHGNACLNVAGLTPREARAYIEEHNLNPFFGDDARAKVIHHAKGTRLDTVQTLLYPELQTSHAVVNRLKAEVQA